MKDFLQRLRRRVARSSNGEPAGEVAAPDPSAEADAVARAESSRDIEPGKAIHRFEAHGLLVRIDRDVLGQYRITVNEGAKRRFSFTLASRAGDYDALRDGLEDVVAFLAGSRRPSELPRNAHIQGHFYGD